MAWSKAATKTEGMQKLRKLRGEEDFDSFSNRFLDNFLCLGWKQGLGKTTCCFYVLCTACYCMLLHVTAWRKPKKHDQLNKLTVFSEVKVVSVMTWSLCNSYFSAIFMNTMDMTVTSIFPMHTLGIFHLESERLNRLGCNLLLSHYLACAHPHRKMIGTPTGRKWWTASPNFVGSAWQLWDMRMWTLPWTVL